MCFLRPCSLYACSPQYMQEWSSSSLALVFSDLWPCSAGGVRHYKGYMLCGTTTTTNTGLWTVPHKQLRQYYTHYDDEHILSLNAKGIVFIFPRINPPQIHIKSTKSNKESLLCCLFSLKWANMDSYCYFKCFKNPDVFGFEIRLNLMIFNLNPQKPIHYQLGRSGMV